MPLEHWLNQSIYRTAYHRYGSDLDPHSFDYSEGEDGSVVFRAHLMEHDGLLAPVELTALPRNDFPDFVGVPACLKINGELRNYFDPLNYRILSPFQDLGRWYEYILAVDALNRLILKRQEFVDECQIGGSSIQAQLHRVEQSVTQFGGGSTNVANFDNAAELSAWFERGNEGALRIEVYPLRKPLGLHRNDDGDHIHFQRIFQQSDGDLEVEYVNYVVSPSIFEVSGWQDMGIPAPPLCAIDVLTEGRQLTHANIQWGIERDVIEPFLGQESANERSEWYAVTVEKCPGFIIIPRVGATIVLSWDFDGAQVTIIAEDESVTGAKNARIRRHHQEWAHWIDEFNDLSTEEIKIKKREVEQRLRLLAREQSHGR